MTEVFMILGFLLASYSIVANDAIQTLGTFLASNSKRPWWVLWIFACGILTVVLVVGWVLYDGSPSWGRLEKFPYPEGGITWMYCLPPLAILILTKFGIPVSTTFLVLTTFKPSNFDDMLTKSLGGYVLAFVLGLLVAGLVATKAEKYFIKTKDEPISINWVVIQWCSTGFLWAVWLTQDLANIFAYLPRTLPLWGLLAALLTMYVLHAWIFYNHGGAIQKIVTEKTNTTDIRAATIIDFCFGLVLVYKLTISTVPMSTTWVFLGLLAGRELALALRLKMRTPGQAGKLIGKDAAKAGLGVLVSLAIAYLIQAVG